MPHYKDGTEAKVGDRISIPDKNWFSGPEPKTITREAHVFAIQSAPETCNARVAVLIIDHLDGDAGRVQVPAIQYRHVTLKECELAE